MIDRALKEVEIVAELAPNEKTRKEAEKLIENCGKWVKQEAMETVLDETKRAIKKQLVKLKREIPKYTEAMAVDPSGNLKIVHADFLRLLHTHTYMIRGASV